MFLLKGHDDLRQDERVMQLFGLVNTLLAKDYETAQQHLHIQRYSVIPLSPNSGLIGWVPNSDTLHQLIRDYRESRKILINIEHRLMLQMAPDYDNLTLIQKVEAFEYALESTKGQDLDKILWLKSKSAEVSLLLFFFYLLCVGIVHKNTHTLFCFQTGVAGSKNQLHSISGSYVDGGLHSRFGRSTPWQSDARSTHWASDPHRLWRLL
jgi:hypothetical protein